MNESKAPSRRILVVDDCADTADITALFLRLLGNKVMTAYTGSGTLATAATFRPEIIFLDIDMPVMSGYDVARRLREMPELSSTVLVALSGWGREEDCRQAKEAGFDRHFLKPTEPSAIEQFLAGLP